MNDIECAMYFGVIAPGIVSLIVIFILSLIEEIEKNH